MLQPPAAVNVYKQQQRGSLQVHMVSSEKSSVGDHDCVRTADVIIRTALLAYQDRGHALGLCFALTLIAKKKTASKAQCIWYVLYDYWP